ncbi:hypothetical protein AKO1_015833, partial [Acrasis kona]
MCNQSNQNRESYNRRSLSPLQLTPQPSSHITPTSSQDNQSGDYIIGQIHQHTHHHHTAHLAQQDYLPSPPSHHKSSQYTSSSGRTRSLTQPPSNRQQSTSQLKRKRRNRSLRNIESSGSDDDSSEDDKQKSKNKKQRTHVLSDVEDLVHNVRNNPWRTNLNHADAKQRICTQTQRSSKALTTIEGIRRAKEEYENQQAIYRDEIRNRVQERDRQMAAAREQEKARLEELRLHSESRIKFGQVLEKTISFIANSMPSNSNRTEERMTRIEGNMEKIIQLLESY